MILQSFASEALRPLAVPVEDVERVQRTVAEISPGGELPSPTWGEYLISIVGRFASWLGDVLGLGGPTITLAIQAIGWLLVVGTAGLVFVVCVRLLLKRQTKSERTDIERQLDGSTTGPSMQELHARVESLLSAGDRGAAIEAMWRWLSVRLSAFAYEDTSWTGRELVQVADRPDLLPMVRNLERLTYGPDEAAPQEAQSLWRRLTSHLESSQS